ncbi:MULTISPECIES: hypothetical protein [Pigmentiphaga]|uniref:Uncharacterized protein n=2 Tax=Pigmentiphaga TaxID=152267 RepID=A0A4Q7NCD3_9BURK|nr:hypothetical protein [Pigmentiphaga kullae]RZS80605.1 hypothetical protein EV675_3217 [Pigmentiphaga kullae]
MKLEDIQQAKMLDDRRRELAFKITLVRGNGLGVTIQGNYQDNEILDAVREHVVAVLESRIDGIDDELRAIGVDIKKAPPSDEPAANLPILPRARKAIGSAETQVGREPLIYTATDMEAYGQKCYTAGRRSAKPAPGTYSKAMEAEDDAWADYNAGRGPHPKRR